MLALATAAACDDVFDPHEALSAAIIPSDTTIFAGDSLTVEAVVEYRSGPGEPDTVVWTVSNPKILSLPVWLDGRAVVEGRARGEAYVIAVINEEFVDSAAVTVVRPGDVRWQVEIQADGSTSGPALDGQGGIYVAEQPDRLSVFEPSGALLYSVPSCVGRMSPSVSADGYAYTLSYLCVNRHGPNGHVEWTLPFGNFDSGVAVAQDGSVVVLHRDGVAQLICINSDGVELWRDTLGPNPVSRHALASAPAIAANGDIYVAWAEDVFGPNWFSRVDSDGTTIWTVPGIGWAHVVSPAFTGDRVITTGRGGNLAVYDTSGVLLWARTWEPSPTGVSSPVVDADGNIYVQSETTLISYGPEGTLRWSADDYGCSACGFDVGAPTLLADGHLLVPCSIPGETGSELCAVDSSDGSLSWRTSLGVIVRCSPTVATDGTIYVTVYHRLFALWGRTPPLTEGWPTEGGDMQRSRRQ